MFPLSHPYDYLFAAVAIGLVIYFINHLPPPDHGVRA